MAEGIHHGQVRSHLPPRVEVGKPGHPLTGVEAKHRVHRCPQDPRPPPAQPPPPKMRGRAPNRRVTGSLEPGVEDQHVLQVLGEGGGVQEPHRVGLRESLHEVLPEPSLPAAPRTGVSQKRGDPFGLVEASWDVLVELRDHEASVFAGEEIIPGTLVRMFGLGPDEGMQEPGDSEAIQRLGFVPDPGLEPGEAGAQPLHRRHDPFMEMRRNHHGLGEDGEAPRREGVPLVVVEAKGPEELAMSRRLQPPGSGMESPGRGGSQRGHPPPRTASRRRFTPHAATARKR